MAHRMQKSIKNAKVGFVFYFLTIFIAFFSRRIFLDCLGTQFIGLTGTLHSILSFINISEVGLATCIGYFLYGPIEKGDHQKINEIVSLFGWLYRIIGSIVLCGGIIVSMFFPLFFAHEDISLGIVYFAFFSFLGSNLIGYFINYRRILLDSDQKTYKVSIWTSTSSIVKTIIQIFFALYYKNLYIWVAVEFLFSLISCWILNYVIEKEYPWLESNKSRGKDILKKYPEILVKAKQIVIHRLKNFFLSKSDEMLIFAFESLQMVAYYGNYIMIVGKLTALFNGVLVGMNASIGNLVAEGNKNNIKKVFWEFLTFRYWVTGIFIISLTFLINPIISWWLGSQFILANHIVFLILLNMYIMLTRPSIDLFINAYGLYGDVWAAYAEGLLNLTITLIVGYYFGLIGILLGKIISMLFLVVLWKPIYLYQKGFQEKVWTYWVNIIIHIIILTTCILLCYIFKTITDWQTETTFIGIIISFVFCTLPIILVYSILVYFFCSGGKGLAHRLIHLYK